MSASSSSLIRWLPVWGGLALLSTACGADKPAAPGADVLISSDFDGLAGWLGTPSNPSLTREQAHSGRYSIKVDGTTEYSLSFASTLGDLHDTRVKRLKIAGWVYVPSGQASALLVTHAGDAAPGTKPLLWDGFDVVKAVGPDYAKWVLVSKVLEVPDVAAATTNIGFFLWRSSGSSKEPVYLDDFTVTAEPGG